MLELVTALEIIAAILLLLGAGGIIADCISPKWKWLNRYIDKLPLMDETNDDT